MSSSPPVDHALGGPRGAAAVHDEQRVVERHLFIGEWGEVPLAVEAAEQEVGEEGGAGQGGQGDLLLRMDEGDEDDGLHGGQAAHHLCEFCHVVMCLHVVGHRLHTEHYL